jgi:hypothetical protein
MIDRATDSYWLPPPVLQGGLTQLIFSGATAVTPAEAAVAATALAAFPKKPWNHGILVPSRTKVATVSPGATVNVCPTVRIRPLSETS